MDENLNVMQQQKVQQQQKVEQDQHAILVDLLMARITQLKKLVK